MSTGGMPRGADQTERALWALEAGQIATVGEFDLAVAPATTTVVTRQGPNGVSSGSYVGTQALSALASNADIVRIVPGTGIFTVTHTSSASARTHRYVFFTGKGQL